MATAVEGTRGGRWGWRRWITPVSWLVATAAVAIAFRAVGARRTVTALAGASLPWLAVAVLANLAVVALWAWQTWLLAPRAARLSLGRAMEVQALTATATNTVPALLGHAAGVALLAGRGGVGTAGALSVLSQHQAVEGLAKLAMLGAAALAAPLPAWMRAALGGLAVVALSFIGVLLVAALRARTADPDAPEPPPPAAGAARGARLRAFVGRWAAGLEALRAPRRFALAVLSALLMKVAEAGGWLAVERAFAHAPGVLPASLPPASPLLALAAVSLASALSATPGNVGVYEFAASEAYRRMGASSDAALALAVAGHVCYLLPFVGAGYVLLTARELRALVGRRRRG